MKLSTRSRYGLRAMIELAAHHGQGPTNLAEIAAHQQVSRKYLDTMFNSLKVAGLAMSRRGQGGGWVLTRAPHEIRVSEVMTALEGSLALVPCVEFPDTCARLKACVTHDIYVETTKALIEVLDRYTLADMVERRAELDVDAAWIAGGDLCTLETAD